MISSQCVSILRLPDPGRQVVGEGLNPLVKVYLLYGMWRL